MVNMTGGTEPVHVTGFVPHAEANRAHHMLLYACSMPMSEPSPSSSTTLDLVMPGA